MAPVIAPASQKSKLRKLSKKRKRKIFGIHWTGGLRPWKVTTYYVNDFVTNFLKGRKKR